MTISWIPSYVNQLVSTYGGPVILPGISHSFLTIVARFVSMKLLENKGNVDSSLGFTGETSVVVILYTEYVEHELFYA